MKFNIALIAGLVVSCGLVLCKANELPVSDYLGHAAAMEAADSAPEPDGGALLKSVVQFQAMMPDYYFETPWARLPEAEFTASGCVIEGGRILTTAHGLIPGTGVIMVQRKDNGTTSVATIERFNAVIDLAVLKPVKEGFFEGLVPLSLAPDIPPSNGTMVRLAGFSNSGPELGIIEGEMVNLAMPEHPSIAKRVNPMLSLIAPNVVPGNSGGPVLLRDNLVAGIAALSDDQEVMAVPASVIRAFLAKECPVQAGESCWIGFGFQDLQNPDIRAWKKLEPHQTGQLITRVEESGSAYGRLKVGDVMTALDGIPIDDNGYITLPDGRRVDCRYHFRHKFAGDTVRISVIRDGEPMDLDVPAVSPDRVPTPILGSRPSFYMHAGLVFMPLTKDLLSFLGSDDFNDKDLRILYNSVFKTGEDAMIVVSRILPDEITEGIGQVFAQCITKINGRKVRNLDDVRNAIESGEDPFIVFEFQMGGVLVFERAAARAATERIMQRLDIPANY